MSNIQCEEVVRYQIAEAVAGRLTREVKPETDERAAKNKSAKGAREIVFECTFMARGIMGLDHRVTRIRLDDGKYEDIQGSFSRDQMFRWLRENNFEMTRNPVRSKARAGTQIERHFWGKSLWGAASIPLQEQAAISGTEVR